MDSRPAKPFTKLLVARYSPKNGCQADDGAVLFVEPMTTVPLREFVDHRFSDVNNSKKISKYGWVAERDPFDADDFISTYLSDRAVDDRTRDHLMVMLNAVDRLELGRIVATTYSRRGVEEQRMDLTVHRVILYGA